MTAVFIHTVYPSFGIYSTTGDAMYPSVAFSFGIIFPGFPITIEWSGTSKLTYAPGAINTSFPIFTFPTTIELVPKKTLFPMIGVPAFAPLSICPSRTPLRQSTFFPTSTPGLKTIPPRCRILNPPDFTASWNIRIVFYFIVFVYKSDT